MSAQSTCLEHVGVVGSPWPVGCYVEYAVLCIAHHLPQQQVQGQNCVWMSWPVLEIPTGPPVRGWQLWRRTGNFLRFFFNFMFIICDSRHEDLQLFWLSFQHWSWLVGKLENVVVSCNTAHIGGLCISLRHWSMCQYIFVIVCPGNSFYMCCASNIHTFPQIQCSWEYFLHVKHIEAKSEWLQFDRQHFSNHYLEF